MSTSITLTATGQIEYFNHANGLFRIYVSPTSTFGDAEAVLKLSEGPSEGDTIHLEDVSGGYSRLWEYAGTLKLESTSAVADPNIIIHIEKVTG